MNNEIKNLEPLKLWRFFDDISRIPRPSKHEDQIIKYVQSFGEKRGLNTIVDEVGNVIIKKPATPGMENRKGIIIQAHLDMVPQKTPGSKHDFNRDPLDIFVENGWVTARETTLGADNGIGVAAALAILDSDDLKHGPVEGLFTIDEETGMTGAMKLKSDALEGEIMLNTDSEDEGELFVGCAGGLDANITFRYNSSGTPAEHEAFKINIGGLKGGHSGMDIALGRGNANKLLFRFLKDLVINSDAKLASVNGGGLRNAIPRDASAVIVIPSDKKALLKQKIDHYHTVYSNELSDTEPDLRLWEETTEMPANVIDSSITLNLINTVIVSPNGVIRMSDSMPGLVETSINLASVNAINGTAEILYLLRSSVDSAKEDLAGVIESLATLAGAEVLFTGDYPGWKPDMKSGILEIMSNTYNDLYGKYPAINAIHAGLECGLIKGIYPEMDMISFGPTISHPHSPDEKVNIETVGEFWKLLVSTLANIPEQK